jgi:argininosuccinate lyase
VARLGRVVSGLVVVVHERSSAICGYSDEFVHTSSIMPQKRNPVRSTCASDQQQGARPASAIVLSVHNTPFGDIVDTEDDLQPLVFAMFSDAHRAVRLVTAR